MKLALTLADKTFTFHFGIDVADHALERQKEKENQDRWVTIAVSLASYALGALASPFGSGIEDVFRKATGEPFAGEEGYKGTDFRPGARSASEESI